MKTVVKILVALAIIALVVFLTLFISAKVGQFDSIADLISYVVKQIKSS